MTPTLNWFTTTPVDEVSATNAYFLLPAFSYPNVVFRSASEIALQFNFTSSRRFVFKELPHRPAGISYVPCVKWRVGTTVTRRKLWDHPDVVLAFPVYNNDIVLPNFCLEIWNLSGHTGVSQATALTLTTSLRQLVTDFSVTPADYEEATGAEVSAASISSPLPSSLPLVFGAANAWLDNDPCDCCCDQLAVVDDSDTGSGGDDNAILDEGLGLPLQQEGGGHVSEE